MAKRSLALLLLCFGALLVAPAFLQAAPVTITKWESLTCKEDNELPVTPGVPEPGYESTLPTPPEQCVGADLSKLYSQAASHPNFGIADFSIATYPSAAKIG